MLDVLSTGESEFPAFTICPDYDVAYKSNILSQYDSNPDSMRKIQFPKSIDMSAKDFFELVTYSLEEILDSMTIRVTDKSENNTNYISVSIESNEWKSRTYLLFGRCYTYKMSTKIRELKVRTVTNFSNTKKPS